VRLMPLLALTVAVLASPAQQQDEPGSKDHPMVPRMPGYYIANYKANDFDGYDFPVAEDKDQRVEGKYWQIDYWLKDGAKAASELAISRNYRNAFVAKGGRQLYADSDSIHTVLTLATNGAELWCDVNVSNGGEVYTLTIVERSTMAQDVQLTAADLAKALSETGSIALHNILFDTGKATITPGSSKELQLVIDVLKADATLRIEVQGHTDNTGTPASNLTLSEQRANAVRDYLIRTGGIAATRLTAVGFGDTKPVAPNTTDEGKAQNRRVELVKK
jgi:outer membrane protein OmpA-like peptidoglycan-associated protein